MTSFRLNTVTALSLLLIPLTATSSQVMLDQQQFVSANTLTLYQQNQGQVQSSFPQPAADTDQLAIEGLPTQLLPDSVFLKGIRGQSIEWSASQDSFDTALKAAIGSDISLMHLETGEQFTARLEALTPNGVQIVRDGKILRLPYNGLWIPQPPMVASQHLGRLTIDMPTTAENSQAFSLSYLTSGLGWSPEYTLELRNETQVELSARALLTNDTQVDFNASQIDLLAGKPNMPAPQAAPRVLAMAMEADSSRALNVAVEAISGYYLFKLPGKIDLPASTHKRVPLFDTRQFDANLSYRYSQPVYGGLRAATEKDHARQWVSFKLPDDLAESPLPQGQIQLYRADSEQLRFIGSQILRNTSPGQHVELMFGDAFDLKVERRQTDYQRIGKILRQSYEVKLINGGTQDKTLEYRVNFNQPWKLIDSTLLPTSDGMEARWLVNLPPRSEVLLSYTVDLTQ